MTFEDLLARDGKLVYKIRGRSMEPMLRQDRDLVILEPVKGKLKRHDAALYRRGKDYVLHRVIQAGENNYLFRGDNTYAEEIVHPEAVIGVLTGFVRKGRRISVMDRKYRLYVKCWCTAYPLRRLAIHTIRGIKRMVKRFLRRSTALSRQTKTERSIHND